MDRPTLPPRRSRVRLIARWVLLGLVIAGVLAMHVLTAPEGPGHQMASGDVMPDHSNNMSMTTAVESIDQTNVAGALQVQTAPGHGSMSAMSCCVLFLVTGFSILLLALRRAVRRRITAADGSRWTTVLLKMLRAPPGSALPRISLCVMRV